MYFTVEYRAKSGHYKGKCIIPIDKEIYEDYNKYSKHLLNKASMELSKVFTGPFVITNVFVYKSKRPMAENVYCVWQVKKL